MSVIINWELLFDVAVQINQELSKLLRRVCHLATSKLRVWENGLHEFCVNRAKLFVRRVFHVANSDICGESCWNLMSTNSWWWIHRSNDLNPLQENKLKIVVVEPFIANDLLKESDELNCVVFVWLGQVDVFKVNDKPWGVSWSVNFTLRSCGLRAHLIELLNHMESRGLGITMDNCTLGTFHGLDLISDQEILSTALRSDNDEGVSLVKPWFGHCHISLDTDCFDDWRKILVLEVVNFCFAHFFGSKDHPPLILGIIEVQE